MSAPAPTPQQPQGQPGASPQDAQLQQVVEQILGGQIPGTGYLFPQPPSDAPRVPAPDAQAVRDELLRAVKACATAVQLPFGQEKPEQLGKAILEMSQSYLLLDPSVDEAGIPVEGPGSVAQAQAVAAHNFPPRVPPNAAEEKIKAKHEPQETALRKTRGQTPRPQPRIGS